MTDKQTERRESRGVPASAELDSQKAMPEKDTIYVPHVDIREDSECEGWKPTCRAWKRKESR